MTARLEALRALKAKVEAGEWADITKALRSPPGDFCEGFQFAPMDRRSRLAWSTYHGSLDAAKALHKAVLPGWFWRISECHLSSDAWVGPDFNCPTHGARLLDTVPQTINGQDWHEFTDVDLRPAGNPARALLISDLLALIALEEAKQ
ncbi:hypothetical protein [Salipiger thiooxidans]|uniref:hypothetical protein n=1 Tax=Salipiger thiooxidans TaxID=282683 RepID=UPI001CD6B90B|nr:hypothetical protein [Salipiger thiooxidans]MCA0846105.1 hypothetical protein [Salipiger thiooxidans]